MSASDLGQSLIRLEPQETLLFKLERNVNSKSTLRVTNISQQKIVFKVKTTQPSWYYVRPNQQVLDFGQTEEIAIVLIESESNKFLDQVAANKPEKLDKHRFLVQSKVISDEEYDRLIAIPAAARSDEYTKIWDLTPKDDKKNIKLRVEFQYPESSSNKSGKGTAAEKTSAIAETAETVRTKFARSNAPDSRNDSEDTLVTAKAEYEQLKKKYDAVVEYTVHLTAERDAIVAQLEEAQRDLSREISKRRSTAAGEVGKALKTDKLDKKPESKGFSLLMVLLITFVAFAAGRYFSGSLNYVTGTDL